MCTVQLNDKIDPHKFDAIKLNDKLRIIYHSDAWHQVTFIYIVLYTIQIVSKQLYSVKQEIVCR